MPNLFWVPFEWVSIVDRIKTFRKNCFVNNLFSWVKKLQNWNNWKRFLGNKLSFSCPGQKLSFLMVFLPKHESRNIYPGKWMSLLGKSCDIHTILSSRYIPIRFAIPRPICRQSTGPTTPKEHSPLISIYMYKYLWMMVRDCQSKPKQTPKSSSLLLTNVYSSPRLAFCCFFFCCLCVAFLFWPFFLFLGFAVLPISISSPTPAPDSSFSARTRTLKRRKEQQLVP